MYFAKQICCLSVTKFSNNSFHNPAYKTYFKTYNVTYYTVTKLCNDLNCSSLRRTNKKEINTCNNFFAKLSYFLK